MTDIAYLRAGCEALQSFVTALLTARRLPAADAAVLARHLVWADLRGVDTHGVVRLAELYLPRLAAGGLNPRPELRIERESAWSALLDGDAGCGHLVAHRAMELAIVKAAASGVGWVEVRNSNHAGMLASYPLLAAAAGCIGFCASNTMANMAPWGGAERVLGNGPLAWAIPAGLEPPVVVDISCAQAAVGKVRRALLRGEQIPADWFLDKDGHPTTDPAAALAGVSLPMGEHKGSGLAVMVEVLTGVLSGAGIAALGTAISPYQHHRPQDLGHTLVALRIDAFVDPADFARGMAAMIQRLRASRRRPGVDRIYVPGERAWVCEQDNRARGVPLHPQVVADLRALAAESGLTFPEVVGEDVA